MHLQQKINRKIKSLQTNLKAKIQGNGVNVFWWSWKLNFGDLFTKELLEIYGYTPIETSPEKCDFVGVGSLCHLIPQDYIGQFLGTGLIKDEELYFPNATFSFVRGELSKKNFFIWSSDRDLISFFDIVN